MAKVMSVEDAGRPEGKRRYVCTLDDGSVENFEFYDDELTFTTTELVGLTWNEVWDLFRKRDIAYLQS